MSSLHIALVTGGGGHGHGDEARAAPPPPPPPSPVVQGDKYRFTVLADGLLRYEWAPDGVFEDRPSTFAARRREALSSAPAFQVRESHGALDIITARFHMTYDKQAFTPSGFSVLVFHQTRHLWRYGEPNETLGGTCRTLDNANGRVGLEPGVSARKGFAVIDDSASFLFTDDGFVAPRRPGPGRVDGYLFCYGHEYREAVRALYRVSGPQPLLPRFALGNWWSRYYEYSARSYLDLMDAFAAHKVPLSVAVIDMDWHLNEKDPRVIAAGQTGWTGYTWNRQLFPDPAAFMEQLHRRRLKTVLNDHPSDGVHSYEDMYGAMARVLHHDTSRNEPIVFDVADRAFLDAYFDPLLKSIEDVGVDFWWIDWQQGKSSRMRGVDPLWMLNHYHYVHFPRRSGCRPIIMSRYAGPGSHRYPLGFSGDTIVSWESLAFQPEFTATASNIGFGHWSNDIGGHMMGVRCDELTARWVQLGVLSPIMRLHSTKNRWVCKEPWKLPAGSGQGPQDVVVSFMRLRHRLIPYLHTMNARAADKDRGEPLVQPMYWEHPERDEAYGVPNQYLFGSQMMVAPITSPRNSATHTAKVRAWLPPGRHVDFFTGAVYDGNRSLWLSRTLDKAPVLLKQGAMVPLDGNPRPENGAGNPDSLEVVVVVGADGHFELLEEDETAPSGGDVAWIRTPMSLHQAKGSITLGPTTGGRPDRRRAWSLRLLGFKAAAAGSVRAVVDGQAREPQLTAVDNGVVVSLGDVAAGSSATVWVGADPQLAVNDPLALLDPMLYDAEIEYKLKEAIDAILGPKGVPMSVRASQLDALAMDADLRLVLTEMLFADARS